MADNSDSAPDEPPTVRHLRNHLAVIIGFCDLLLAEIPKSDREHADILEIRSAATAAMALRPDIIAHTRQAL